MDTHTHGLLPVFAAGFDIVITIIIIVVSLIGWLVNLAQEQAKKTPHRGPARPRRGPGKRRPDHFQQEIDQFLQEVGGKAPRRRRETPVDIEVVLEEEPAARPARRRKLSTLEDRHVSSSPVGEGVVRHVQTHMRKRIEEEVRHDFEGSLEVVEEPEKLTTTEAAGTPGRWREKRIVRPREIVEMLRDPLGIQKAVVVNEILKRPRFKR